MNWSLILSEMVYLVAGRGKLLLFRTRGYPTYLLHNRGADHMTCFLDYL